MRPRQTPGSLRVEMNMTPMIDVVFQLLTFFMFTLRPLIPEGQFAVNMSAGGVAAPTEEFKIPPLAVHLRATEDGELAAIALGDRVVRGFDELRVQVQALAGGGVFAEEIEAEIHADDALKYTHLISAVNTLTAAKISKINFAGGSGG